MVAVGEKGSYTPYGYHLGWGSTYSVIEHIMCAYFHALVLCYPSNEEHRLLTLRAYN